MSGKDLIPGRGLLGRAVLALACAAPLAVTGEAALAGGRHHDDGWRWGHRHRHHQHHRHHDFHHHGGSGISGRFVWDLSPPPPPVLMLPPPVVTAPPPPAYCREYTSTAIVNGRPVATYGTACRQPDGRWRIVTMN